MYDVAELIADLVKAGTAPELVGRVASAIAAASAKSARSNGAERQARYRERLLARDVTSDADVTQAITKTVTNRHSDVTSDASVVMATLSPPMPPSPDKEIPPTPPKENNLFPLTPTTPAKDVGARMVAKRSQTGSRLPDDWVLPRAWGEWALLEFPQMGRDEVLQVAEQFRDYWVAVPGQKGRKADWLATWRNWMRNQTSRHKARGSPAAGITTPSDAFGKLGDFYRAQAEREGENS